MQLFKGVLLIIIMMACSNFEDKHVGIQPLGSVQEGLLDSVAKTIHKVYGFEVDILPSKEIPQSTFINQKSPRYRADKLIRWLKETKPDSLDFILGLLEKDISTTKRDKDGNVLKPISRYEDWGVFGLGYRPGASSVVSTFRFKNREKSKFTDRLKKICTHELGHNLGLKHCPNKKCVMTDAAESIKTIDNVNLRLCASCTRKVN